MSYFTHFVKISYHLGLEFREGDEENIIKN